MMSVTYLNNKRVLNFFKHTLKKQTPITLLVTVFCLLFCPGTLISQMMERIVSYGISVDERPDMYNYFSGYAIGIFVIVAGLSILLTVLNFGFLYSKKSGDVFYALPLTRKELLAVRMVSSFIGGLFTMSLSFLSLSFVNIMPGVVSVSGITVLSTYLAMVLALVCLTVFATIFAVCSGGIFDFIIAIGGINVAIPIIYIIFQNFVSNNAYGVVYKAESGLKYTSPFVFATVVISNISTGAKDAFKHYLTTFGKVNIFDTILFVAFTALCVFVVYKLFQIRRSETAGEAYSFFFMPHIISVLVSIVGGYVIGYIFTGSGFADFDFWIFFIIGTALCSVTAGAIFSRGFKTVKTSLIRGATAIVLTIVFAVSLVFVGAYHENYIPKAKTIEKITVGYSEEVVFTDKFDVVLDIHKLAFDISSETNDYEPKDFYCIVDEFDSIRMKYYLKNGRVIEREYYSLVDPSFDPLFIRYAKSDEYIKRYLNFEGADKFIELRLSDYEGTKTHNEPSLYAAIEVEQLTKLATAYAEEFKNSPDTAFYESCDILEIYGMNSTTYGLEMRIPESFTKTREILSLIKFSQDIDEETKYKLENQ